MGKDNYLKSLKTEIEMYEVALKSQEKFKPNTIEKIKEELNYTKGVLEEYMQTEEYRSKNR